jgi:hypothetical protein
MTLILTETMQIKSSTNKFFGMRNPFTMTQIKDFLGLPQPTTTKKEPKYLVGKKLSTMTDREAIICSSPTTPLIDEVEKRVSIGVTSSNEMLEKGRKGKMSRENFSKSLGLTSSLDGNQNYAAGYFEDAPKFFVKVVDVNDPSVIWARNLLETDQSAFPLFPTIYSVTTANDKAILIMSRVKAYTEDDNEFYKEKYIDYFDGRSTYGYDFKEGEISLLEKHKDFLEEILLVHGLVDSCTIDSHDGNFVTDENGLVIFVDPLYKYR